MGLLRRIADAVSDKSAADARRTLIVEDNPDESRAMAQALERAGFPAVCVTSVGEAMAEVEALCGPRCCKVWQSMAEWGAAVRGPEGRAGRNHKTDLVLG